MRRESDNVKVAVVGAGYFGRFHIEAWKRIQNVDLVAIVDKNPELAVSTDVPVYADLLEMLDKVRPEVVDIVTPPNTHLDIIRVLMASDVNAIICQKPFCGGLEDAKKALELSLGAKKTIVVHENFRFQPWYRYLAAAIDRGTCGDVLQFTYRLRTGDGQGDSAYQDRQPYFREMPRLLIHETGVHFVDTFRYLLGEPLSVYADLRRLNPAIQGEDAGSFIFEYANGARAMFDGNRLLDNGAADHRVTLGDATLEGTNATCELRSDGSVDRRMFGEQKFECVFPKQEYQGFAGDCVYQCQSGFIAAYLAGNPFENEASDYLSNLVIVEAIYESARLGKRMSL